jgi:hypothetical protein
VPRRRQRDPRSAAAADLAVFGEVGLGGEIRQVAHSTRRLTEAARLGFSAVIVPANAPEGDRRSSVRASTLSEAIAAPWGRRRGYGRGLNVAAADSDTSSSRISP